MFSVYICTVAHYLAQLNFKVLNKYANNNHKFPTIFVGWTTWCPLHGVVEETIKSFPASLSIRFCQTVRTVSSLFPYTSAFVLAGMAHHWNLLWWLTSLRQQPWDIGQLGL